MNKQLNQIRALMRADETAQAQQQLKVYLKDNPKDAQGWFLASFLQATPQARFEAIQRAAYLSPDQPDIQKRFAKLSASAPSPKRSYWLPLLIIVVLASAIILALVLIGGRARTGSEVSELPTLAVLPTITPAPTQPIAAPDNPVGAIATPTTELSVLQPQVFPSETAVPSTESIDVSSATPPDSIGQIEVTNLAAPTQVFIQPGNPAPLPTTDVVNGVQATPIAPTTESNAPTHTPTPLPITPPTPTSAGPTPVFQLVSLDNAINISAGQFRVVDATRGAESAIHDLGGTFPPAPPNQSWVLLELLLVCQDGNSCVYDPSGLKIMGSSGTTYPYSKQLNLTPIFGTVTQNNQIWGYLGYTVPTSETQLKLILAESSQTYAISLEQTG